MDKFYRVTTILQPFSDFENILPHVLENAAERGQLVHDYCSAYALGGTVIGVRKDCKPYFDSFKMWFDKYVSKVFVSEKRFFSYKYMITGKIDIFCFSKAMGGNVLIDIKTPQKYMFSWKLQVAAYRKLMSIDTSLPSVDSCGCLMLSKKGSMAKYMPFEEHEEHWKIYKGLLDAYIFFDNNGQNKYSNKGDYYEYI